MAQTIEIVKQCIISHGSVSQPGSILGLSSDCIWSWYLVRPQLGRTSKSASTLTYLSHWPLSPCCTSFTQASSSHLGYSQHGDLAITFLNWLPGQKIEAAKPITATPRSASALNQHILLDKNIIWPVQNARVKKRYSTSWSGWAYHRRVHETGNIVKISEKYNLLQPTTSVFCGFLFNLYAFYNPYGF